MRTFNRNDIKTTLKGAMACLLKRHVGPFKARRKWLAQTQWWPEEKLKQQQLILLQRLVKHAYETVPHYQKLMKELGIKPQDIKSLEDIEKFPVMHKADMKRPGNELVSSKYSSFLMRTAHTGGTTGLPVPLRRDLKSIGNEHAFVRRQFDWAGVSMKDRCAYLEGRSVSLPSISNGRVYAYDAVMKELTLSTFHLSAEVVPSYAQAIKDYKVEVLVAYPSSAYMLAKGCLAEGISLPLRCVMTTAETLDDGKREVISRAFNCKVVDFYGSAERVCYIHTCEKGSYHIIPEYGLTELHPAEAPNEDCCRIVATGFWNMAMPLIRYDIGDLVRVSQDKCKCGRVFPVVDRIFGRDSNVITTPSGLTLGASAIECILARVLYGMYEMPVLAGRVIQEADDLVTLEYVPTEKFSEKDAEQLQAILRKQVPAEMRVDIRRSKEIDRTPRGKYVSFVMAEHH